MESSPSFGMFSRLPREIRDQIWSEFMPWSRKTPNRRAQYGLGMHQCPEDFDVDDDDDDDDEAEQEEARKNRENHDEEEDLHDDHERGDLAVLRLSHAISEEVAQLLYNCHLGFTISTWATIDLEPQIAAWIYHNRFGIFFLPNCNDAFEKRWIEVYEQCKFIRWRSVTVNLLRPKLDEGGLFMCWKSAKQIVDILELCPPSKLFIRALGNWQTGGELQQTTCSIATHLRGGDLRLLMLPFGRLIDAYGHGPRLFLDAQKDTHSALWGAKYLQPVYGFRNNGTMRLRVNRIGKNFSRTKPFKSPVGDLGMQIKCDAWLDAELDTSLGWKAALLRIRRWTHWTIKYEIDMINKIRSFECKDVQELLFARFAERWAVWRTMNPIAFEGDRFLWPTHGTEIDYYTHVPDNEHLRDARSFIRRWESLEQSKHGWRGLKEIGYFYKRSILITSEGIRWDTSILKPTHASPEIYYRHPPPPRPENLYCSSNGGRLRVHLPPSWKSQPPS